MIIKCNECKKNRTVICKSCFDVRFQNFDAKIYEIGNKVRQLEREIVPMLNNKEV